MRNLYSNVSKHKSLILISDHEITLKILEFMFNSKEKVKAGFYFAQCVHFLNRTRPNPNLTAFTSKIQIFCRQEWNKWGTLWKLILTIFKCKNEFPKQLGLEKQKKKIWSFVWFSCLLPELRSLNCQKLWSFCNFLLISAKNVTLHSHCMHLKVLVSLF